MESLHLDITHKILSHVPPESALNCKLVCKTWRRLLSHVKVKAGLLFAISQEETSDQENSLQLYYGYYDDIAQSNQGDQFSYTTLPKINLPPIKMWKDPPVMLGSCNGLVCFSIPQPLNDPFDDLLNYPVYICNPLTGEYVNLPNLSAEVGQIGSGFGYLPKTNEYKVVLIHYPGEFTDGSGKKIARGLVQVYTLGRGGDGWRNIGETTDALCYPGVAGDGVIHFMDDLEWKLVTFDLAEEEFLVLPQLQPPCLGSADCDNSCQVKVLGGHLYVVHLKGGRSVDLWSFNKSSASWSKELSIPWNGRNRAIQYHPFSLTSSNQVLFSVSGDGNFDLCCYDPKTESVQTIASEDKNRRSFQTIQHMNSLVSLKDLGVQSN
ncbi:putative F-box protein At1g53370 [Papaver somniferum]|uniref:putative F-box protein At1g53370 n=1 Tax=Papaver somniferum TaxID=3469 RepID=UPI000E6F87DA|nr:putative F-box protein At1g53370 [Papaver somniferum]